MSKSNQFWSFVKLFKKAWENTEIPRGVGDKLELSARTFEVLDSSPKVRSASLMSGLITFEVALDSTPREDNEIEAYDENVDMARSISRLMRDFVAGVSDRFGINVKKKERNRQIEKMYDYYKVNYLSAEACDASIAQMESDLKRVNACRHFSKPLRTLTALLVGVNLLDIVSNINSLKMADALAVETIFKNAQNTEKSADLVIPVLESTISELKQQAEAIRTFIKKTTSSRASTTAMSAPTTALRGTMRKVGPLGL